MSAIDEAAREFRRLPGIGSRTAIRLVFHLLRSPRGQARQLADSILGMIERVRRCEMCGNFAESATCTICADSRRDRAVVCVVESPFDVRSIDRTGRFPGLFHVLGGVLSPLDGIGPDELRIAPLIERVRSSNGELREVILATNSSVEGEATAVYLEKTIRPLGPRVTRLARGLPVGSDLSYVNGSTLAEALSGRREM